MKRLISKLLVFMMIVALYKPMSVAFAADQKAIIAGSTSVQPLTDELAAEFMKKILVSRLKCRAAVPL